MSKEIERKFTIKRGLWTPKDSGILIEQGYLCTERATVRVRLYGQRGFLTIKGKANGITRAEFEYPIPRKDADDLMDLCEQPWIMKHRHVEKHHGKVWEIDVFHGANEGLIVAEVELSRENERVELPEWIDREVSKDRRYSNSHLIKNPFKKWKDKG
jgi:adenylate cyclase